MPKIQKEGRKLMTQIKTIDNLFYKKLGEELTAIRKFRNMSLRDISKITGFSTTLIDRWELGLSKIKPTQFEKLCEALKVTNSVGTEVKIGFWRD